MFKGKEIRKLRKERNYSLEELAKKGAVSVSYLSEIERELKKPSLATIERISAALNVSSKELIDEKKDEGITLGERIKAYRTEKGMSLKELSANSEISYSYLCEIEKGDALPSINTAHKIADGLQIHVSNLMAPISSLGNKLTNIREEQRLNQAQLAKKAGVSPGLIGQIEKGKVQPSLQTIEKIAAVLEISPCYFVVEEDGLQEVMRLLNPDVRWLLTDRNVIPVLKMLRQCNEKEFRFVLDFIKLVKESNLCDKE